MTGTASTARAGTAGRRGFGWAGTFALASWGNGAAGDQLDHLRTAALLALHRGGGRYGAQELFEHLAALPAFI